MTIDKQIIISYLDEKMEKLETKLESFVEVEKKQFEGKYS